MIGVAAAIPVTQQRRAECVLIWTISDRRYGQRQCHLTWLENALRRYERDALACIWEAFGKNFPRQHLSVKLDLLGQPYKCGATDCRVSHTMAFGKNENPNSMAPQFPMDLHHRARRKPRWVPQPS